MDKQSLQIIFGVGATKVYEFTGEVTDSFCEDVTLQFLELLENKTVSLVISSVAGKILAATDSIEEITSNKFSFVAELSADIEKTEEETNADQI